MLELFQEKLGRNQIIVEDRKELDRFLSSELVQFLKRDLDVSHSFDAMSQDMSLWNLDIETEKMRLYSKKKDDDGRGKTRMLHMTVRKPLEDMVVLFKAVDLLPEWMWGIESGDLQHSPCEFKQVYHWIAKKFLILNRREAFLAASIIPDEKEQAIVLRFEGIETPTWLGYYNEKQKDTNLIKYKDTLMKVKSMDKELLEVTYIFGVNLEIPFVP
eukprot:CAMPEP_0202962388 /NCGR_PEP_ID=MMETSP1396-20130829/6499_1 /ASSEMBLY_ACC=CAM_ASM_000872 /TAXON_ID= /ORGANISM="Pseudokeronopsis sp., Strain Brazil" /LENGTH=214 /DNA_ID=CAMNT_0049682939 /DNA_START=213 /DNA_END=857 /DNA_ORIENTATION=+